MKILCVIDSLGSGGAQRQLVELAKRFKEKGNDISFLIYHNIIFFQEDLLEHKIPVTVIEEPNYFRRILKMRIALNSSSPDVVLSFLEGPNFICEFASLPFKRWKLIVGERSANPKIRKSLKLRFYRFFHFFADHVVFNSFENKKIVKKVNPFLPSYKLHVIYNIIDQNKWSPDYNILPQSDSGTFNLIVVASIRPEKNTINLIEAVNLLEDNEKKRLTITWYGSVLSEAYYKEVRELIEFYKLKDVIHLHDSVTDIHLKVKQSDALGLFSLLEGLPNTVCEAITMGKPVIASAVSDVPILLSQQKALLCSPDNISDISSKISHLLSLSSEELSKIGELNRIQAKKLLSVDKIVNSYLELFNGK